LNISDVVKDVGAGKGRTQMQTFKIKKVYSKNQNTRLSRISKILYCRKGKTRLWTNERQNKTVELWYKKNKTMV